LPDSGPSLELVVCDGKVRASDFGIVIAHTLSSFPLTRGCNPFACANHPKARPRGGLLPRFRRAVQYGARCPARIPATTTASDDVYNNLGMTSTSRGSLGEYQQRSDSDSRITLSRRDNRPCSLDPGPASFTSLLPGRRTDKYPPRVVHPHPRSATAGTFSTHAPTWRASTHSFMCWRHFASRCTTHRPPAAHT
jgi:hypothetical protein